MHIIELKQILVNAVADGTFDWHVENSNGSGWTVDAYGTVTWLLTKHILVIIIEQI